MDEILLKKLEFDKILDIVSAFTVSAIAGAGIFELVAPQTNKAAAENLLNETEEAFKIYYSEGLKPLIAFDDAQGAITKAKVSALLTLSEIRRVMFLLRAGRIAKTVIEGSQSGRLLKDYTACYKTDWKLEKDIDVAILSDTEVADSASIKLRDIRRRLAAARAKLADTVKKYSRSSDVSKYLQDDLVTLRDGRYVLPVKTEYRGLVPGLVHDRSQTGATLFIEPFNIVESNNEIRSLQIEEGQEIERIIRELIERIALIADNLSEMQAKLTALDVVFAKAHFGAEYDCVRPPINDQGCVVLIGSRHPLIERGTVVPVSVSLGISAGENDAETKQKGSVKLEEDAPVCRILTITGPNTGGKTVVLKTIGLFCLMAAAGLFIPAREGSETAVFDNIFADIGDQQSIESSLSTFSSHIKNIVYILDNVTKNSLVLLDELGGGTDPEEGAALALGIIKYLELVGACVVLTTHYGQLKQYAMGRRNIQNASMQFDNKSLRPTYRLIEGLPGSSNALKIAGTLGVNDYVIREALNCLPQDRVAMERLIEHAEEVKNRSIIELEQLYRDRAEVEKLKAELLVDRAKLKERLQKIQESAKSEIRRIVSNSADTAAELIEQIKEQIRISDEKALLEAKRLMKKIENIRYDNECYADEDVSEEVIEGVYKTAKIEPINPDLLREGMDVYIISLEVVGRILKLNRAKGEASVRAGAAVANIKFDNLAGVSGRWPVTSGQGRSVESRSGGKGQGLGSGNRRGDHRSSVVMQNRRGEQCSSAGSGAGGQTVKKENKGDAIPIFTREINVMGHTVAEALELLDGLFLELNDSGEKNLRIVHGKGTGALGKGIQAYLKNEKSVKSFRYGGFGEGETGVTIVEFKE
ncbi:MAG: Smr/MutS family protein [Firmicutes bacterium]|nr:Smr/MutS family protein [Bacillota bacterium]